MGYIGNPLDPWGADDERVAYRVAFEALASSGAYDVLAVVHDSPFRDLPSEVDVATTVSRALIEATRDLPGLLPVHISLTSGDLSEQVKSVLDAGGGMPMLRGATEALAAIARLAAWEGRHANRLSRGPWRSGWPALAAGHVPWAAEETLDPLVVAVAAGGTGSPVGVVHAARPRALSERESLERLAAEGLAVTPFRWAPDAHAAVLAWRDLGGGPAAVKLDAEGLAHKTEAGGVILGVTDEDGIHAAARTLEAAAARAGARVRGFLVEPMAPAGVEVIVGGRRDPVFGPVVLVGLGGILAEVLDDVAVLLAPVSEPEARAALDRLRGARLLHGVRGRPAVDLDALAGLVAQVGRTLVADPSIAEIDLNPVIASPGEVVAVDALLVVDRSSR
jgi:acetyl-CoA synthetase